MDVLKEGFHPEAWQVLYAAVARAAAALTGLLFVAFSLNLRLITGNPMHMGRSRETLATLVILLMVSLAVLIPGQSRQLLGTRFVFPSGLGLTPRSSRGFAPGCEGS